MEIYSKKNSVNFRSNFQRKSQWFLLGMNSLIFLNGFSLFIFGAAFITKTNFGVLALLILISFFLMLFEQKHNRFQNNLHKKNFLITFSEAKAISSKGDRAKLLKLPPKEEFILCFGAEEYENDAEVLNVLLS